MSLSGGAESSRPTRNNQNIRSALSLSSVLPSPIPSRSNTINSSSLRMELVLSIQTSLLDSDPTLTIESEVAATEVSQLTDVPLGRFDQLVDNELGQGAWSRERCRLLSISHRRLAVHLYRNDPPGRFPPLDIPEPDSPIKTPFASRIGSSPSGSKRESFSAPRIRGLFTMETDPEMFALAYREFAASDPPLTA